MCVSLEKYPSVTDVDFGSHVVSPISSSYEGLIGVIHHDTQLNTEGFSVSFQD